jgi:hypothetical protein
MIYARGFMKAMLLVIALCLFISACAPSNEPADAVESYISALNDQDSAALVNSFSEGVRTKLATVPESVRWLLDTAKGTILTPKIYSVTVDDDIANIMYAVEVRGKMNLLIDSVWGQAYNEGGRWKYGFLFTKQQFVKVKPLN